MDLRKAHLQLLRAERLLVSAAKEAAQGGVTARTSASLSAATAAAIALAGAFAEPFRGVAGRALALSESLESAPSENLTALARLFAEAHPQAQAAAELLGARLIPMAEGLPKNPPLVEVQQLLALISF